MKSKTGITRICIVALAIFALSIGFHCSGIKAEAATKKTYTVSTKTKPVDGKYVKSKSYNSKTKHYYMLRSYLERLEKNGGGTLVLKKGTYNITNVLSVPSNVTIKLSKGVVLKKLSSTGTKGLKASNTMFYLVPPSKQNKKNSTYGYKGSKNISIIAAKGATIDMNGTSSTAIYMAHNNNVSVKGITFKNVKGATYIININGCNKVNITNCSFSGQRTKTTAIVLDMPAKTKKQTKVWVKQDNTMNANITVTGCNFNSLNRGLASVRFVSGKYHSNVVINSNVFRNIQDDVIRAINLKTPVICGNMFNNVGTGTTIVKGLKLFPSAVYLGGVTNPTVSGNFFTGVPLPISVVPYKNTDSEMKTGNTYTKNSITNEQLQQMYTTNSCKNCVQPYVKAFNNARTKYYKYYFFEEANKTYRVTPKTKPYNMDGMTRSDYNSKTKHFFMLQSYLFQIEANGGGTLILGPGDYYLPAEISVGSNTTIQFERKAYVHYTSEDTGGKFAATSGMFALVSPRGEAAGDKYKGYNGVRNVKFVGPVDKDGGIDSNGESNLPVVMIHNQNVTFKNMTFKGMNGGHFIEMDASKDVLVENCVFSGIIANIDSGKEAINIDIPDKYTYGVIRRWTSYDQTPCTNVTIRNNVFSNLTSAIGSHHYTPKAWHTNIYINNNTFEDISYYPVRVMQMKDIYIENNTFTNIGYKRPNKTTYIICMQGVNNPVVKGNVINSSTGYIHIGVRKIVMDGGSSNNLANKYPVLLNTVSQEAIQQMLTQNTTIGVDKERAYVEYSNTLGGKDVVRYKLN